MRLSELTECALAMLPGLMGATEPVPLMIAPQRTKERQADADPAEKRPVRKVTPRAPRKTLLADDCRTNKNAQIVLQRLANAGIVRSYRGHYGGYLLAVSPNKLTLQRIIEAVEGPMFPENQNSSKPVRQASEQLRHVTVRVASRLTLADLSA